ncbi:hypothetical protein [Gimesia sp.]|uniref:hypothetical protein n=1 Tax=Gimesia sp. TaxID=2024833 RepID=UPI003A901EE9
MHFILYLVAFATVVFLIPAVTDSSRLQSFIQAAGAIGALTGYVYVDSKGKNLKVEEKKKSRKWYVFFCAISIFAFIFLTSALKPAFVISFPSFTSLREFLMLQPLILNSTISICAGMVFFFFVSAVTIGLRPQKKKAEIDPTIKWGIISFGISILGAAATFAIFYVPHPVFKIALLVLVVVFLTVFFKNPRFYYRTMVAGVITPWAFISFSEILFSAEDTPWGKYLIQINDGKDWSDNFTVLGLVMTLLFFEWLNNQKTN